jgi:L-alanine-DL-glutamate epimerase-like enolase superfamily enzyme
MKVKDLRTIKIELPLAKPLKTSIHDIRSIGSLLVLVEGEGGVTGESHVFALGTHRLGVLDAMVQSLKPSIVGADIGFSEAVWSRIWREINFFGHKGVSVFGLSAIDGALWDLRGKAMGQPIHRLLGACRDAVPTYASAGLWLSLTTEELAAEAKAFVAQGFRAVKMRLGKMPLEQDVERVAAVRAAIGPEIALMADANQGFTVDHAIRLGRRIEEFGLGWFEEPVPAYDLEGSARVAAALDTPIASGETEYTRYGFRAMLEAKAADVLMPDLARVGGVSEFIKVGHLAAAFDVPISSHVFTEQSLSLMASLSNATYLEHMPWFGALYREKLELRDGMVPVPERPGFGFTLDLDVVDRHRI